ncbi:MAG: SDR family oxidoreductase [Caulobacteraceae bacterium]|nr:SDR family oxidoreductase [Caulobacteraceae bacterium]
MARKERLTVVTGANSGMGRATAELLRSRGERVIGLDLAQADVAADVATPVGRRGALEAIAALAPDGLDAVIACAGVAIPDGPKVIAVNYFGTVALVSGLWPLLQAGRDPRAVVISSSASIYEVDPALVSLCLAGDEAGACARAEDNPNAYASSKRATSRWIRRTAITPGWADRGVLLNGIAPGVVRTPMTEGMFGTEEGRHRLHESTPRATASYAAPTDVAPLLAFLASPENRYMVGQIPFCDGGTDVLLRGEDIF